MVITALEYMRVRVLWTPQSMLQTDWALRSEKDQAWWRGVTWLWAGIFQWHEASLKRFICTWIVRMGLWEYVVSVRWEFCGTTVDDDYDYNVTSASSLYHLGFVMMLAKLQQEMPSSVKCWRAPIIALEVLEITFTGDYIFPIHTLHFRRWRYIRWIFNSPFIAWTTGIHENVDGRGKQEGPLERVVSKTKYTSIGSPAILAEIFSNPTRQAIPKSFT